MDKMRWNLALNSLNRPVHYDKQGQWISDVKGERVCDIRGWGRIQYLPDPENRQDAIGELIVDLINNAKEK